MNASHDTPRPTGDARAGGWTAVAGEPGSAAWRRLRAVLGAGAVVLEAGAEPDGRATVGGLVRDPGRWGLAGHAHLRPVQLSRGLRSRLAVATALQGRDTDDPPPAAVLEQPDLGLDAAGLAWLADVLRTRAAAAPVLCLTWAVALLRAADTVVLLDGDEEAARGGPQVLDGPVGRRLGLAAPA